MARELRVNVMLRFLKALLLAPLIVCVASAATHRIEYTFEVRSNAPAFGLSIGDEIKGWIDMDASVPDTVPGPGIGLYTGLFVDYGFTSHAFATPAIASSAIIVDNNDLRFGQYWAGHIFGLNAIGSAGPHFKNVNLSAWQSGVSPFGFIVSDAIPTTGADITISDQYGSTFLFEESGVQTQVGGDLTAVSIRPLAVPEGSSTLALLGVAAFAALTRRFMLGSAAPAAGRS